MNPEQSELLIRVDQNVINLVNTFEKHIKEDKEFQKYMYDEIQPLKNARAEGKGMAKLANILYILLGSIVSLAGTFFFSQKS